MKTRFWPALGVIAATVAHAKATPAAFEAFCFTCHDATQTDGELDLEALTMRKADHAQWRVLEEIIHRIEQGDMPPKKARKKPSASEREEMIAWAREQIDALAAATQDDPGRVVMSRLTREEYRRVIRDLSGGVVVSAGAYLPNEGGAGEGFSNVGEAQGMGLAQFEKYLEAAKGTLRHLRVSPHDGLVWSAVPREPVETAAAQIREATDDLIAWHVAQQQKWGAQHREQLAAQFGSAHAPYLAAAKGDADGSVCVWKGPSGMSVPLSPGALKKWQRILLNEDPASPFADWARAWRALPTDLRGERLLQACLSIVEGGAGAPDTEDYAPPYEISFHEAREEVIEAATQHGHWPFRIDIGDARELFLVVTDAGDGGRGEYAVWQKGRVVFKDGSAKPWQDVVRIVGANSGKPFDWGVDGEGSKSLGADAIGVRPPGAVKFAVPPEAIVFEVDLTLDKNRSKLASIQALVLKEKPRSQSYVPGRYVFGGRKRDNDTAVNGNRERDQLLRKRNVSEANLTKVGLNAERNIFAGWNRTPLEAIGGPWPAQTEEKVEPNAPYHYTVAEVLSNATPEDLGELRLLEDRLFALTQPLPPQWTMSAEFARRAWRRELSPGEQERLARLYREALLPGVSFDSAMKAPLLGVLMSPEFLYKAAEGAAESELEPKPWPLSSNQLASRLSFFLWSSVPDEELLAADLIQPEVLKEQARRMLRDPRAASLAEVFAAQAWQFEDFENHSGPDETRFPEFTAARRHEMLREVVKALNLVFLEDAPLSRLLDEDCLATKPLFLTKTSLPLRTSPVQRGAWVVETLLGRRIPPPPPNVPQLSADEKSGEGLNIQQQLARHRAEANCAACHARIDPPGIALENYDPIGRWREVERDGTAIVNAETLHDGTRMNGVAGLKSWLKSREDEFRANFHRKLLGYALGRAVLPGDQALLERLNLKRTFSAVVIEIVTSPQFMKRGSGIRPQ